MPFPKNPLDPRENPLSSFGFNVDGLGKHPGTLHEDVIGNADLPPPIPNVINEDTPTDKNPGPISNPEEDDIQAATTPNAPADH